MNKEIDSAIKKVIHDLSEIDSKYLASINKQKDSIEHTISEIKKSIDKLNKFLDSYDTSSISTYKSRNAEFRRLPPKLTITLPSFIPQKLVKEHIGSLSALSIKTEEQDYISPPDRPLIDEPCVGTDINTKY